MTLKHTLLFNKFSDNGTTTVVNPNTVYYKFLLHPGVETDASIVNYLVHVRNYVII